MQGTQFPFGDGFRHRERIPPEKVDVLMQYLNASISNVQKWENGDKKPSGAAARLLSVIERKGMEVLLSLGSTDYAHRLITFESQKNQRLRNYTSDRLNCFPSFG